PVPVAGRQPPAASRQLASRPRPIRLGPIRLGPIAAAWDPPPDISVDLPLSPRSPLVARCYGIGDPRAQVPGMGSSESGLAEQAGQERTLVLLHCRAGDRAHHVAPEPGARWAEFGYEQPPAGTQYSTHLAQRRRAQLGGQ